VVHPETPAQTASDIAGTGPREGIAEAGACASALIVPMAAADACSYTSGRHAPRGSWRLPHISARTSVRRCLQRRIIGRLRAEVPAPLHTFSSALETISSDLAARGVRVRAEVTSPSDQSWLDLVHSTYYVPVAPPT